MQKQMYKSAVKSLNRREVRKMIIGYAFIMPMIINLLIFNAIPFIYSLYLAMTDFNGLAEPNWVGLRNFITMFTKDTKFLVSLKVTFKFAFIEIPLKLSFALMVAMLLSRKTKTVGFYRTAFYVPSVLGGSVAVAMTWKLLWANNGAINSMLRTVGIEGKRWLMDPSTALGILILLGVWQFGASMLIFLAGLKNIPQDYYEAAIVDGASAIDRFFKITLPLLTPSIFYNLVTGLIANMQVFNSAYLVTSGGPVNATMFYALNVYEQAFEYNKFGYASALAWFMLLIIVILTSLIFKSSSGWVYYNDEG